MLKKKKKVNGLIGHPQENPPKDAESPSRKDHKEQENLPGTRLVQKKNLQARITHPYHFNPSKSPTRWLTFT